MPILEATIRFTLGRQSDTGMTLTAGGMISAGPIDRMID
jgi:hypothetical protein